MGKPRGDVEDYELTDVNGIGVYVRRDVQTLDDGLAIKYAKFLFKESLTVDGIAY